MLAGKKWQFRREFIYNNISQHKSYYIEYGMKGSLRIKPSVYLPNKHTMMSLDSVHFN